jgi:hypothetical protein
MYSTRLEHLKQITSTRDQILVDSNSKLKKLKKLMVKVEGRKIYLVITFRKSDIFIYLFYRLAISYYHRVAVRP